MVNVGVPANCDSDYVTPAVFVFPVTQIMPTMCYSQAVYSCQYTTGPYLGGLDLCGTTYTNGDFYTEITFDITTGTLVFNTDDYETFPPGTYNFVITITVGSTSVDTNIVIILQNTCQNQELTITQQPESHYYYVNGDSAMVVFTYNLQTIVVSSSGNDCGEPVVVFTTAVGLQISVIYEIQCTGF